MEQAITQLDPDAVNLAKAIRQVESGGNFQAKGRSGEYGAYQYTPATWASDSQKFLGKQIPLVGATKEQQNEVAYKKIKFLKDQGYNVGAVASIWNSGSPDKYLQDYKGINSYGASYDVPKYAKSVATAYHTIKGGGQVGADPNNPSSTANTTPLQKSEVSAGVAPEGGYSAGGFAKNVVKSGAGLIGGIANMALHPIDTIKNVGGLAVGAVEKLIPGMQGQEYKVDAVGKFFKDRYGGIENVKNTFYNDPVGAILDLSTVLTGGGALVTKIGTVGKMGELAKAGNIASKVGEVINPIGLTGKAIAGSVNLATKTAGNVLSKTSGLDKITGLGNTAKFVASQAGKGIKQDISALPWASQGGLGSRLEGLGGLTAVMHPSSIPALLPGLAMTSPRFIAETARALGLTTAKLESAIQLLEKSGLTRQEIMTVLVQSTKGQK